MPHSCPRPVLVTAILAMMLCFLCLAAVDLTGAFGALRDRMAHAAQAQPPTLDVVGTPPPQVVAISPIDPNPTNAPQVRFAVTFDQAVTGVDISDFSVMPTVIGAVIIDVTGSGAAYTVTIDTGTGDGSLPLTLLDDDSIVSTGAVPQPLAGVGGGTFSGERYLVDRTMPEAYKLVLNNISTASVGNVTLMLEYHDNMGIDLATLDAADLRVVGPRSFDQTASFVAVDAISNCAYTAIYALPAPGGNWDATDNGIYTVLIAENEVLDTGRNSISAGTVGQFTVAIPAAPSAPQMTVRLPLLTHR